MWNVPAKVAKTALRVPCFWIALGGVFGILAADQSWIWILGNVFIGGFLFQKKCSNWWLIAAVFISGFLFAMLHHHEITRINQFSLRDALEKNSVIEVSGEGWFCRETTRNGKSVRAILELDSLTVRDVTIPIHPRDRLVCWIDHGSGSELGYGTAIHFSGQLKLIEPATSPGAFDPSIYFYRSANSIAELTVRPGDRCEVKDKKRGSQLTHLAIRSRSWMENALLRGVSKQDRNLAGVILAMVLGAREESPDDLEDFFRLSGTMHIFAVSGLHVAVVASLFWFVFKWLGFSRSSSVLIIIPAILFYALLTGLRPSSFRAALMLSVFLAGFALKQRPSPINAIGVAGLILLWINSQQLFQPGFQLSFCVVIALALSASFLTDWLHRPFEIDAYLPRKRVPMWRRSTDDFLRLFAGLIAISLASWLGSALLMSSHFRGISPIGLIANVFMVPLAGVIVIVAGGSIALTAIKLGFLSALLNNLNLGLAAFLTIMAQFFASFPGAHLHTGSEENQGDSTYLNIDVMGVGGESSIFVTDSAHRWMIDSGGQRTFRRQALPLLRENGINQLDCLILTHGDSGHIGAAPYILTHLQPDLLIESPYSNRSRVYPEIRELVKEKSISRLVVKNGQRLHWNKKVTWEILYPGQKDPPTGLADDRCLVIKIRAGPWRILCTSDIGFQIERLLIKEGWNLQSDIWIRGQHSATKSGSPAFVSKVNPRAILSTKSNFPPYERLDPDWVRELEKSTIKLLTLDEIGSARIRVKQDELIVEPYANGDAITFRK